MDVELCRGVEILSASECGLLGMLSCVVLTVLEKVSIIEFVYLVRSCVDLRRDAKFYSASAREDLSSWSRCRVCTVLK